MAARILTPPFAPTGRFLIMPDSYSRIFLLSHMRAFTSLTGHILGSNPEINGYYEMHLSYEDASALERQLHTYREHDPLKEHSRFLFDKLLHNDCRLIPGRLGTVPLNLMVSLREPAPTISSIVNLFARKPTDASYASPESAARYYIERLQGLAGFCRTANHVYRYFDAELIVEQPEKLLAKLTEWLDLREPLSERYHIFSQTGQARKGDSSPFIHRGRIDRHRGDQPPLQIPRLILESAERAYAECRSAIRQRAAETLTR